MTRKLPIEHRDPPPACWAVVDHTGHIWSTGFIDAVLSRGERWAHHGRDRFVQPAFIDQRSPVKSIGICSSMGHASQNKVLSTLRGTEIVSDRCQRDVRYDAAMRFLARLLLNALALVAAAYVVPGLHLASPEAAVIAGIVLGLINAVIRPFLILITLPLTLLTLGLFIFVVNAICLSLTAWVVPGFTVDGFLAALLGALVVSVVSWILSVALIDAYRRR